MTNTRGSVLRSAGIVAIALTLMVSLFLLLSFPASAAANITGERAKSIALEHAGLQESQAAIVKNVGFYKRGSLQYKVVFRTGQNKYVYLIDGASGGVLANYQHATADNSSLIGADKAKAVALEHAGVSAQSVREYDCDLDYDHTHTLYEIEFKSGGMEYELEIDAVTGAVVYYEADRD